MIKHRKKNRDLFTGDVNVYDESTNELKMTLAVKNQKKSEFEKLIAMYDGNFNRFTPSFDFISRHRVCR